MRRFLVRFIRPDSFVHTRSSAGFTITTSEFEFSVHTGNLGRLFTSVDVIQNAMSQSRRVVIYQEWEFKHLVRNVSLDRFRQLA